MTCSFAVGAFALNDKPEKIELEEAGITLILPDDWKGKYSYERYEDGGVAVYHTATRDCDEAGGWLFSINSFDEILPMNYSYAGNERTIAVTATKTYTLCLPSEGYRG